MTFNQTRQFVLETLNQRNAAVALADFKLARNRITARAASPLRVRWTAALAQDLRAFYNTPPDV
jgi:hypothetical protein